MCTLVLTYITCSGTCQWTQHLANPGRTGYIACDGPDAPEILWKTSIDGGTDTPPLIIGDTLLILRKDSCAHHRESSLLKMNLFTGEVEGRVDSSTQGLFFDFFSDGVHEYLKGHKEIWRVDFDKQTLEFVASVSNLRCRFRCHPIILEDKIVYPTAPLFCFSRPDFTVLWNTDSVLPDHTNTKIMNAAVNNSYVFVITEQQATKEFYALHLDTGEIAWSCKTPTNMFSIAVDGSTLFIGGDTLRALDTDTGDLLWEVTPQENIYANLIVGPDHIFAADHGRKIYAIDKTTGKVIWKTEKEPDIGWTFLAGGGTFLYCASGLGERSKISCFSTQDGTKVWEYIFDQEIHTHPALSQGVLVVALLRGDIYAFATEPGDNSQLSKTPPPTTSSELPPDTLPPSTEPSQTQPPGPEPSHLLEYLIMVAGIIIGILILYMWQKIK